MNNSTASSSPQNQQSQTLEYPKRMVRIRHHDNLPVDLAWARDAEDEESLRDDGFLGLWIDVDKHEAEKVARSAYSSPEKHLEYSEIFHLVEHEFDVLELERVPRSSTEDVLQRIRQKIPNLDLEDAKKIADQIWKRRHNYWTWEELDATERRNC